MKVAVPTDVTDQASVGNMVERVLEEFGRIDLLLNDAGSFNAIGPVWEVDPQEWWGGRDYNSIWQLPVRSRGLPAHDRAGEREDCEYERRSLDIDLVGAGDEQFDRGALDQQGE